MQSQLQLQVSVHDETEKKDNEKSDKIKLQASQDSEESDVEHHVPATVESTPEIKEVLQQEEPEPESDTTKEAPEEETASRKSLKKQTEDKKESPLLNRRQSQPVMKETGSLTPPTRLRTSSMDPTDKLESTSVKEKENDKSSKSPKNSSSKDAILQKTKRDEVHPRHLSADDHSSRRRSASASDLGSSTPRMYHS